jgi:phosphate uptake regulator
MNSQVYIHALRVQLLAMSRLSQRALDYSVKGYELRNLDFARQVGTANEDLEQHYRRIRELCREAVNGGIANVSDFRFAFAALSVAASLRVTIFHRCRDRARHDTPSRNQRDREASATGEVGTNRQCIDAPVRHRAL